MSGSPRETTPILWIRACRPRQEPPSHNPFAVLDREGVGGLVRIAAEDARTHKPGIKLADDAEPVLAGFGNAVPRLVVTRPPRRAVASVDAGQTNRFTGVMCSSYHDIWMELHEDLIFLQGIDRTAEGSF